ncbi:hypothetical protein ANRL3_02071 [Anaerolineae bacterium]|nr:hypothetical protein ANRL3_02071 [Anaerolineae bacterium]
MTVNYPIPEKLQSDHLVLLVGTNPLPNLVTTRLLAKPHARIILLYSNGLEGEPSTKDLAENLETALKGWQVQPEPIASSDNQDIETRVAEILGGIDKDARVGMNYTGGTKPMSLHTYRALQSRQSQFTNPFVFSYLDPRQLALRIDRAGTTKKSESIFYILRDATLREKVMVTPNELAALHGYERVAKKEGWREGGMTNLCNAIAKVHASKEGFAEWRAWTEQKPFDAVPKKKGALQFSYAELENLGGAPLTTEKIARWVRPSDPDAKLSSCGKWFRGLWLEEHVVECLKALAPRFQLSEPTRGALYRAAKEHSDTFELDITFTIGYQLYAISCIATDDKPDAKEHWMEIFVRARQIGGDEARIGLVTCYDDPARVQKEIERKWDAAGKLRVFGRGDLGNLKSEMETWLEQASLWKGERT